MAASINTPLHRLTPPSYHPVRPTLSRMELSALQSTQRDLEAMVSSYRSYLSSPFCDQSEKYQVSKLLESVEDQLDDVKRQIQQG